MAQFRMNDDDQEAVSAACRKDFDPAEDMTRQELFPETDLATLLRRYQPFELPARDTVHGTVDYSLDRHQAVIDLRNAQEALARRRSDKAAEASAGSSAEASGASPSDSAAAPAPTPATPAPGPAQ